MLQNIFKMFGVVYVKYNQQVTFWVNPNCNWLHFEFGLQFEAATSFGVTIWVGGYNLRQPKM